MKILRQDKKNSQTELEVQTLDDLWYLTQIISKNDFIISKTTRKINLAKEGEKSSFTKKTLTLKIQVEKLDFQTETGTLRVSGPIQNDIEDIPKGSFHSIKLEPKSKFILEKTTWLSHQTQALTDSTKPSNSILFCIFDREQAILAISTPTGYKKLNQIQGEVDKKDERVKAKENFYKKIIDILIKYNGSHKPQAIIIASPAFYNDYLLKESIPKELKEKFITATTPSVDHSAIKELLRQTNIKSELQDLRAKKELDMIDTLLAEIKTQGKATYGQAQVQLAADSQAIEVLLITDAFISKKREQETYNEINNIMIQVEKAKAQIMIIRHESDAGKQLDGLSGIAAILRFKIN